MKAGARIFNMVWRALFTISLPGLPFSLGHFLTALMLFDVTLIVMGRILHKKSEDSEK